MTKLVIFDLDGTLLDTLGDLAVSCNHALKECGFPERETSEYKMLVGRGIYNLFRDALPEGNRDEATVQKMAEIFIPYYDKHKCDLTKPYPGILNLLGKLSQAGVRMAIASNKYQEGAESIVQSYFGQFGFVKVLGQRDGRPIKPSPMIVEEIMAAEGLESKEEVVYIGDSGVDMQTGLNAGVRTVGVTWGFRSKEELLSYGPLCTVDSPEELDGIILGK